MNDNDDIYDAGKLWRTDAERPFSHSTRLLTGGGWAATARVYRNIRGAWNGYFKRDADRDGDEVWARADTGIPRDFATDKEARAAIVALAAADLSPPADMPPPPAAA